MLRALDSIDDFPGVANFQREMTIPNNFLFGPPRLFGVAYINNVVIKIFCVVAVCAVWLVSALRSPPRVRVL